MWGHKYGAKRCSLDGHNFPSLLERDVYMFLKARQDLGQISNLEMQVSYPLRVNGRFITTYKPDFRFKEKGRTVICEAKGKMMKDALIKIKLFAALYPELRVDVLTRSGSLFNIESFNP